MKKFIFTLVLVFSFLINVANSVSAENYKYKLYDPVTNKTYYASMMTLGGAGGDPNVYYLGLFSNDIVCVIKPGVNKNKSGLVGGTALGMDNRGRQYKWRELDYNNYYREMHSIIQERKKEGYKILQDYIR